MSTALMKYKDYVWPRNPRELSIVVENDVKDIEIPKNGSVYQDYGRKKRIVSGKGEFCGQECFEQYRKLFNIFKSSSDGGYLVVPNLDPFLAIFKSLKLIGDPTPNLVSYSFVFWEDIKDIYGREKKVKTDFYIADGTETLWDISLFYNIDVKNLLELNPFVKDPNDILSAKVRIRLY